MSRENYEKNKILNLFKNIRVLFFLFSFAGGAVTAIRTHTASAVAAHTLSDDIYQGKYEHCQKYY